MTREDLLQKVSAAIDETLYAYSHGEMSDDMAKESILTIADEWATDDDEILAHMEMLVRDYGAADDNSLTAGAKVLKRRVLVACAPLMNLTAVLEAIREPSERMLRASDRFAHTDETENIDWKGIARVQWRAMIDALIAEVRPETMNTDPQAGRPNP